MRSEREIDLFDELTQHLSQAQAVVDYMAIDIAQNGEFTVSQEIIANMLWTAQTLLKNANTTAIKFNEVTVKGGNND